MTDQMTDPYKPPIKKAKKAKKPRCAICNKKLKLFETEFNCQCNGMFCTQHKLPFNHDCSFQVEREINHRRILEKNNEVVVCEKVIQI